MPGPHHVYANDQEIASRSSDGKSTATGDVCFTPPVPKKVGTPVPYSNVASAKDIRNGSRTVFIAGKEVALSDKSYFHTSVGNEPATTKYKKGVISNAITGRAYFHSWSPNVKVEGEGVARHMDLVSHNHSNPANTALFPFISRGWRGRHDCQKKEEDIEKACNEDGNDSSGRPRKNSRRSPLASSNNSGGSNQSNRNGSQQHWTNRHCGGLLQVSNNLRSDQVEKALKSANQELQDLQQHLSNYSQYAERITQEIQDYAAAQGVKVAAKAGVKQVVGSFVPGVGNAVMGLWTAYDVANLSAEVASRYGDITEIIEDISAIDDSIKKITEMKDRLEGLANGEPLTINGKEDSPSKVLGDMQDALALTSRCLRARKCSLVPYENKSHIGSRAEANKVETSSGRGCCPGQTGHHLIPGSMIEPKPGKDSLGCASYDHAAAPVVCVESANQHSGSHGRVHDAMDSILQDRVKASQDTGFFSRPPVRNGAMSMDEAIKAAAESHAAAFPLSGCSKKCIEAQLKDYYNTHCRRADVRVVNKGGRDILPDFGDDD